MASEQKILHDTLVELSKLPRSLVFRNNTGSAWQGAPVDVRAGQYIRMAPGMKVLRDARPIHFGLQGSGDILGSIDHIPVAVETKTPNGRQSQVQYAFGRAWEKAGGLYILARDVDEARAKVNEAIITRTH